MQPINLILPFLDRPRTDCSKDNIELRYNTEYFKIWKNFSVYIPNQCKQRSQKKRINITSAMAKYQLKQPNYNKWQIVLSRMESKVSTKCISERIKRDISQVYPSRDFPKQRLQNGSYNYYHAIGPLLTIVEVCSDEQHTTNFS